MTIGRGREADVALPGDREVSRLHADLRLGDGDLIRVGRLARYQYLNMDQVTAQALTTFDKRAAVIAASARRRVAQAA